ncbi:oxidoreductase [Leifsonia sp. ku-ls]|nr:oxidoreductase [Leifsonia sp. ku-ls]
MAGRLDGSTVLVIGGTRRLGAAIASAAASEGARVSVSSHRPEGDDVLDIDLRDEASVAAAADRLGAVDHVVSTAGMGYRAPIAQMDLARVQEAFSAKITGPLLIAKHFDIRTSLTFFSGQVAWRPGPGTWPTGIANGALSFTATHLAAELAPVRVNTLSPGIVDSGSWDDHGAAKGEFLQAAAQRTLVGSTGTPGDIVQAVLWILTAPFLTGETIRLDGGRR